MKIEINYKTKYIQDVKVGDYVKSFNIETNKYRHNKVSNTILPIVAKERQTLVVCKDGTTLTTSNIHPMCFLNLDTNNWEYKNTEDLKVGDIVKGLYTETTIEQILIGLDNDEQFYDLTVDQDNNFLAGDTEENMIVVHNSTTVHFPIWNKEIEEILVLKNNKGTDDNRVRKMDYSIQISKLFWERMVRGEDISLFSTSEAPGLYEAFGTSDFNDLYVKYENNRKIPRKTVNGKDLLLSLSVERMNTGRIYIQNIDNVNSQGTFLDKITMSNLCQEIDLPTSELYDINDGKTFIKKIKIKKSDYDKFLELRDKENIKLKVNK